MGTGIGGLVRTVMKTLLHLLLTLTMGFIYVDSTGSTAVMMLLPQEELKLRLLRLGALHSTNNYNHLSIECYASLSFLFYIYPLAASSVDGFFQGAFIFPFKVFFPCVFLFVFPFECGLVKPFLIVVMSQLHQTVDTNEVKVEDWCKLQHFI